MRWPTGVYASPNFLGEHGVLTVYGGGPVVVSGVWPRSVSGVLGVLLSGMSDWSTYDEYGNSTRLNPAAAGNTYR